MLIVKFIGIFVFPCVFVDPGFIAVGIWASNADLYLTAQSLTKREMSKANSLVIAHFRAAVAGISKVHVFDHYGPIAHRLNSVYPRLWCTR